MGIQKMEKKPQSKCRYWRLWVSCGKDRDGKRIQRSMYFRGTYTEAKAKYAEFEETVKVPTPNKVTFRRYAQDWMDRRAGIVASSTAEKDMRNITVFNDLFGDEKLTDITPLMIEEAFHELLTKGGRQGRPCKTTYINALHTELSSIFNDAVARGYLIKNPARDARRIPHRPAEKDVPDAAGLRDLLSRLDCRDRRQMAVYLTAATGMRRGEATALRRQDVDLDNMVIHIRHALRQPRELAPTKTGEGRRDLPITKAVADHIRIRYAAADADLKAAVAAGKLDKMPAEATIPVCCDEIGDYTTPMMVTSWWKRCKHRYGQTCSDHDLRHAYLSMLAAEGVPPATLQALAGHKSPITTLGIYTHANLSSREQAVSIAGELLSADTDEPEAADE